MIARFNQLSLREKRLLGGGALILLAALIYQFYWLPLRQWAQDEHLQRESNLIMQQKMVLHARQHEFIRLASPAGEDIRQQLILSAQKHGVTLQSLKINGQHAQFSLPPLPARVLWQWLSEVESKGNIEVMAIVIQPEVQSICASGIEVRLRNREAQ